MPCLLRIMSECSTAVPCSSTAPLLLLQPMTRRNSGNTTSFSCNFQVSMQWMQALLQSGLPKAMWHTVQQWPQLQQQQSSQQHQQLQYCEAVAGSSNTAGDSIASPQQRRVQDLGLKSLLSSSSSTTMLNHQPESLVSVFASCSCTQHGVHISCALTITSCNETTAAAIYYKFACREERCNMTAYFAVHSDLSNEASIALLPAPPC